MHEPLVAGKLLVIFIGTFIAYRAYTGYRDHGSEPMLYLAVGFGLISLASGIEGLLFEVVNVDIFLASTIQTAIALLGMVTILYSLYGSRGIRVDD
ncbi:DUF7521 family protein [Haloarchaeobius amylolyticus]|uniref:DUF7521 family protein n=1 Tax=Haloarchaeobius amylolyticus TaxID=1198296 RepID=UPI0022712AC6|nr:hypothetical protein [Haloarchaeobius amylolyticus]